ncbi:hypothetical protein [Duganella violaceipulchra]|uniref:Restriction endonuclease type IV Mrr domain-containing protein n=1 Tax=Duganella violaceipulchra TaxID=2849652 RepID=A0AA41H6A3_9BURK|nr:hypothetical protein [Duganella violaceicalia]MBV6322683.1 hypothetical protein [Duganella violaceicalia]MCP2010897.1 hypothetical protein [Duganella violaceicalia]
MPTIPGSQFAPPRTWDEFEDIALSAAKIRWGRTDFFRNGRSGQRQRGVDIFGTSGLPAAAIGIQCKNTIDGVSEKTVLAEIQNAESFNPPLTELYIATTASRDSALQEKIRIVSAARAAQGKFTVNLLFWSDLVSDLAKDRDEFFKHFPAYAPVPVTTTIQTDSGKPIFTIEQLRVVRHPALSGKRIRRRGLATLGKATTSAGIVALLLTLLPSFFGRFSNWTPASMLLFGVGMTLLAIPEVLKRRRFEHIMFGRYYLELNVNDDLCINRLTATCPWCESHMDLRHLGPKDGPKEDIFVCERNSKQHTILLDPTILPEITD